MWGPLGSGRLDSKCKSGPPWRKAMHLAAALAFIGLLASSSPGTEEPARPAAAIPAPCADDPDLLEPVTPGATGVLVLTSSKTYQGRVVAVGGGKVAFKLAEGAGEIIYLPASEVRGIVPIEVLGARSREGGPPEVRVVLTGGCVVGGRLAEAEPGTVALESPGSGRRELSASDVKQVMPLRAPAGLRETRQRYLEVPSAMLGRGGEMQVSSIEGTHLLAVVGLTDFLTLEAGSALPMLHTEPYGANGQAAARAGVSMGRLLHLAAGAHVSMSGNGYTSAFLSATVTVGRPEANLTIHAGPMFPGANRLGNLGDVGMALAGSFRTPAFDVVGETWVSRALDRTDALFALAGRLREPGVTLDVGLATTLSRKEIIPWLGLTMDVTLWS